MAQLSLYMDDASMEELRSDAEAAGKSISSYAREVLEQRNEPGWWYGLGERMASGVLRDLKPLSLGRTSDSPPEPVEPLNTL